MLEAKTHVHEEDETTSGKLLTIHIVQQRACSVASKCLDFQCRLFSVAYAELCVYVLNFVNGFR